MKKNTRIVLIVLKFVCIACFLFSIFYLLMILGSSHKISFSIYSKIIISVLVVMSLYFYISFKLKKKKNFISDNASKK